MKIFISHSAQDAEKADELQRVLSQRGESVVVAAASDGPGEISAKIRSSDIVVAYLLQPSSNTFVELGIALGSGRATVLVGSVGEPSIVDELDLPSVAPSGSALRDAHAVAATIERVTQTLPERTASPVTLDALAADPAALEATDYQMFETLVLEWFEKVGAVVEPSAPDEGCDFRLRYENRDFLVEVKKLSRQGRVPVEALRSLIQAVHVSGSAGGILITSSPLTSAALSIARENSIAVLSLPDLVASSSVGAMVGMAANKAFS